MKIHPKIAHLAVEVDTLIPYHANPRDGDIGAISESLAFHGQYKPITVNIGTNATYQNQILTGNHTYHAAVAIGADKIAATWVDVDDEQAAKIVLVDNRTSDLATYKQHVLTGVLSDVISEGGTLEGTGYYGDDVDELFKEADLPLKFGEQEPRLPPEVKSVVTAGDVWKLGRHTLTCGDAFNVILDADTIITDPPYGINLDTDFSYHEDGKTYRPVANDDKPFDPSPLFTVYDDVKEQFWFGADYYRQHLPPGGSWFVWDKRRDSEMTAYDTTNLDDARGSHFELCWSRQPHRREMLRIVWAGWFGLNREQENVRVHPTQKPVYLMERLMTISKGQVIADPFAGSGATLLAAERLNVTCNAVELDPGYCDLVIARWEAMTDDVAIKVDGE